MFSTNVKHNIQTSSYVSKAAHKLYKIVTETIESWFKKRSVDYYRDPENLKWYKLEVQWVEMSQKEIQENKKHINILELKMKNSNSNLFEDGLTLCGNKAWPKRKWLMKQPIETIQKHKI